jgi:hypothetical protein
MEADRKSRRERMNDYTIVKTAARIEMLMVVFARGVKGWLGRW